jgi:hypothetical protein
MDGEYTAGKFLDVLENFLGKSADFVCLCRFRCAEAG